MTILSEDVGAGATATSGGMTAGNACARWGHRAWARLKATGSLVASRPHVLIIPLAVFALCVGFGVFGVVRAGQSFESSSKEQARVTAQSAAKVIDYYLQVAATPLAQLSALVLQQPNNPAVLNDIDVAYPAIWQAVPTGATSITIAPLGVVMRMWPMLPWLTSWLGTDQLATPDGRASVQRVMNFRQTATTGPIVYVANGFVTFLTSVHVANTTVNETFGFPGNQAPFNTSFCIAAPDQCYDHERNEKWWGIVSISCDLSQFTMLQKATESVTVLGFDVQVKHPVIQVPGLMQNLIDTSGDPPSDAAVEVVTVGDEQWEVYVWTDWQPNWLKGMYAVVVVGAFIISALLMGVLYSWEVHRTLLHSLLPKQTIQRLRGEVNWSKVTKQDDLLETVSLETPAGNMLQIIAMNIQNEVPSLQLLLSVRDAVQRSANIYRPTVEHLKGRMKESEFVDAEVRQALVAQLVGSDTADLDNRSTAGLQTAVCDLVELMAAEEEADRKGALLRVKTSDPDVMGGSRAAYGDASASQLPNFDGDLFNVLQQVMQAPPPKGLVADTWRINCGGPASAAQSSSGAACLPQAAGIPAARHASEVVLVAPGAPTLLEEEEEQERASRGVAPGESVPASLTLQLEVVLATADSWAFDAYALEAASCGRPLSVMGYYLLHTTGLITWARMDPAKLVRFLQRVEDCYPNNPYHNRRHAAYVLQALHVILHRGGFLPGYADELTLLGCYISALVHDVGHKGCNNDFLVNAQDDLAVRYNDKSPMENHHVASAFSLLKKPELNCLSGLSKAKWLKLRKLVIDLVLATDMKAHFATVGQFDAMVRTENHPMHCPSMDRHSPRIPAVGVQMHSNPAASGGSSQLPEPLAPASETDRLLSLQVALKCADVGHLTSPLASHLQWVSALEEEFFLQGDAEKAQHLTVSPLCDRTKEGVTKSQVGFFDFVVVPMYKSFCGRFPATKPLWHALMENYRWWSAAAAKSAAGEAPLRMRSSVQPSNGSAAPATTKPDVK